MIASPPVSIETRLEPPAIERNPDGSLELAWLTSPSQEHTR